MTGAKYIVFDIQPQETIVVFPAFYNHAELQRLVGAPVLGAGFIISGQCIGESMSLGVKSRPEDQDLFDAFIKGCINDPN